MKHIAFQTLLYQRLPLWINSEPCNIIRNVRCFIGIETLHHFTLAMSRLATTATSFIAIPHTAFKPLIATAYFNIIFLRKTFRQRMSLYRAESYFCGT